MLFCLQENEVKVIPRECNGLSYPPKNILIFFGFLVPMNKNIYTQKLMIINQYSTGNDFEFVEAHEQIPYFP